MMRITYYALRPLQVGDDMRQPGDLVPEAAVWPFLSGYVRDGHLAPVLVATLPANVQAVLTEWETEQDASTESPAPAPTTSTAPQGDGTTADASKSQKKEKVSA